MSIAIYVRVMWVAGLTLGINLSAVDRLPQLTLNSYSQPLGFAMAGSEKDMFSTASAQFIAAQGVDQYIEILLSVRHNQDRLKLGARYEQFVREATHTVFNTIIDTTFDILDSMIRADRYWQYQQAHQAYYYFHKHPAKWFDKELQQSEIHKHREQLSSLQKIYFAHIGTATQQLKLLSIVPAASPTTIAQALQQMAYIVGLSQVHVADVGTPDQQVDQLAAICNQISLYSDRAARALRPNKIPAPLHRYGLSAITGAAALVGYLKVRHDAHAAIDGYKNKKLQSIELNNRKIVGYVHAIFNPIYDITGEVRPLFNKLNLGMQSQRLKLNRALDTIKSYFCSYDGPVGLVGTVLGGASSLVTGASIATIAGAGKDKIITNIDKTIDAIDRNTSNIRHQIHDAHEQIPLVVQQVVEGVDTVADISEQAVTYGTFVSKVAVTVGLPLAVWAGYKLATSVYSTVHAVLYPTSDYCYTRQSMIDIAHILNNQTSVNVLPADQLGALIYHMHVISEISVADEYAEQFAQDVSELAGEGYDVMQKLRIIDRMYRTYPFLNVAAC